MGWNMVVGRGALVIKRNSLIRLQRRVGGMLLRPERKGGGCSFELGPGSYMPARGSFEPAHRMIPSKRGLVSPQLPSAVILL